MTLLNKPQKKGVSIEYFSTFSTFWGKGVCDCFVMELSVTEDCNSNNLSVVTNILASNITNINLIKIN